MIDAENRDAYSWSNQLLCNDERLYGPMVVNENNLANH